MIRRVKLEISFVRMYVSCKVIFWLRLLRVTVADAHETEGLAKYNLCYSMHRNSGAITDVYQCNASWDYFNSL